MSGDCERAISELTTRERQGSIALLTVLAIVGLATAAAGFIIVLFAIALISTIPKFFASLR